MVEKFDENGFFLNMNQESMEFYDNIIVPMGSKKESSWFSYIMSVGGSSFIDIKSEKFKSMVREGIPNEHRPAIWAKLAGLFPKSEVKPYTYMSLFERIHEVPSDIHESILIDVPRTFPKSKAFLPENLSNVLHVFALSHPEIGYCQSLNFLCGVGLAVFKNEEQAFWLMCAIVEDYLPPEYYVPSMIGIQVDLCVIKMLFEERTPDINKAAETAKYSWIQATSGWLLALFSNSLPMPTVLRIWDAFLSEGHKIIFRVCIAILRMNGELLMSNTKPSDFPKIMISIQKNLIDQDRLMEIAFAIKMFSREHLLELRVSSKENVIKHGIQNEPHANSKFHSILGQMNL